MRIFGLDFTSSPSFRKPITCAICTLQDTCLYVNTCQNLPNFADFEAFLRLPGPWIAALDFPFGQPAKLITDLNWPASWQSYISHIASLGKTGFEATLATYITQQASGDKLHLRTTDTLAGARSPMMLHRVPVAKMFFQGTPRLLASGVSILPCHPTADDRIVLEGYPALVARKWIGKQSYKSDERSKQTLDKEHARRTIVEGLLSHELTAHYGLTLKISTEIADMLVYDPMADSLDAPLCAIQAAWAYRQRDNGYGIPVQCDSNEGWIVDPTTLGLSQAH